ncbi:hypothetical protein [Chengkuizengella axinellae]|uniref:Uncharacterized protein n=1 Tax=Chengkuizengella axinellae TaxID=3064388 RepID=A0ABT9J3Z8_9BACL|nr:hypothetical protein [Chengkuizengella sp. 2205SS18-9]MDP5276357.1 hypothetical protein [Chengkuizengella sp. 2205SS18-9]
MGVFDETKCDCCVCPMQCVLEQLVEETIFIQTVVSEDEVVITGVKDFIVSSDIGNFPICQITQMFIEDPTNTLITRVLSALKPIKNSKEECACCEDPMTNLLKFEIGNTFEIEFIGPNVPFTDEILGVGEGIVIGVAFEDGFTFLDIFSSCAITRTTPVTQQQINDPDRPSRRNTPPPA